MNIYEKAANHLYNMTAPAILYRGEPCFYRVDPEDKDCNRCAVGAIISDEHYHEGLEYHLVNYGTILEAVSLSNNIDVADIDVDLLSKIQNLHDGWAFNTLTKEDVNKKLIELELITEEV